MSACDLVTAGDRRPGSRAGPLPVEKPGERSLTRPTAGDGGPHPRVADEHAGSARVRVVKAPERNPHRLFRKP